MHQQVKLRLLAASSTNDGSGAMAVVPVEIDPSEIPQGALLNLLELLSDCGYNLRMAGGSGIETGGEFTFAIEDDDDDDRASECAAMLALQGSRQVRLIE